MFYNGVLKTNDPDLIYMLRSISIQKKDIDVDKEFDLLKDYIRYKLDYFEVHGFDQVKALMNFHRKTDYLPLGNQLKLLSFDEYKQQHD